MTTAALGAPLSTARPQHVPVAEQVRDGVVEAFGVTLRPEPVLVNCSL